MNDTDLIAFTLTLQDRFPSIDWPPPSADFWKGVRAALGRFPKSPGWADRLATQLQLRKLRRPDDLAGLVQEEAGRHYEQGGGTGERAEAEGLSRDCEFCGGAGMFSAPHPYRQHLGRPMNVAYVCLCPMGRWLKKSNEEAARKSGRAFLDVRDFPEALGLEPTDARHVPY